MYSPTQNQLTRTSRPSEARLRPYFSQVFKVFSFSLYFVLFYVILYCILLQFTSFYLYLVVILTMFSLLLEEKDLKQLELQRSAAGG